MMYYVFESGQYPDEKCLALEWFESDESAIRRAQELNADYVWEGRDTASPREVYKRSGFGAPFPTDLDAQYKEALAGFTRAAAKYNDARGLHLYLLRQVAIGLTHRLSDHLHDMEAWGSELDNIIARARLSGLAIPGRDNPKEDDNFEEDDNPKEDDNAAFYGDFVYSSRGADVYKDPWKAEQMMDGGNDPTECFPVDGVAWADACVVMGAHNLMWPPTTLQGKPRCPEDVHPPETDEFFSRFCGSDWGFRTAPEATLAALVSSGIGLIPREPTPPKHADRERAEAWWDKPNPAGEEE